MQPAFHINLHTPIGWLRIAGDDSAVCAISFCNEDPGQSDAVSAPLLACKAQLQAYFQGEQVDFDLQLRPEGTDFQCQVWNALVGIPFGQTRSYLQVAQAIRKEKAVRAVGAANGKNHLSIVVPCHRVIGADGSLTGYAGELWRKKWLLQHEHEIKYGKQGSLF